MKQKPRSRVNRKKEKTVLRLPDLEHAKTAVLNKPVPYEHDGAAATGQYAEAVQTHGALRGFRRSAHISNPEWRDLQYEV
jgi:hypothetical protein